MMVEGFYEFWVEEEEVLVGLMEEVGEMDISFRMEGGDGYGKERCFGVWEGWQMELMGEMEEEWIGQEEMLYEEGMKFE